MRGDIEEAEAQSGYCKPFKTDNITVESCKERRRAAVESKDKALRRCRKCEGLFVDKTCKKRLFDPKDRKIAKEVPPDYCTECGKHKSEVKKFHKRAEKCSACYQNLWRAGALD